MKYLEQLARFNAGGQHMSGTLICLTANKLITCQSSVDRLCRESSKLVESILRCELGFHIKLLESSFKDLYHYLDAGAHLWSLAVTKIKRASMLESAVVDLLAHLFRNASHLELDQRSLLMRKHRSNINPALEINNPLARMTSF